MGNWGFEGTKPLNTETLDSKSEILEVRSAIGGWGGILHISNSPKTGGERGFITALYKTSSKSQLLGSAEGKALCRWLGGIPQFPLLPQDWGIKGVHKFVCH